MKKTCFLLAVLLLLCIPSVFAQQKVKSLEVTPFFTWENFDSDLYANDNLLYGAKVGLSFAKNMEAEFVYSMGNTDFDSVTFLVAEPWSFTAEEEADLRFWSFNFIYNFKPLKEKIVLFAEGGLGRYRIRRTTDIYFHDSSVDETTSYDQMSDSQSSPTYMIGGGVRYFVNKRFALRIDITGTRYEHDIRNIDGDIEGDTVSIFYTTDESKLMNIETSIGFSFFFGGKE